jgi:tetrachlorobenzoquinone reductase
MLDTQTSTSATQGDETLATRISTISYGGEGLHLFELSARDGGLLPVFTAGAHVDVHLPCGVRQYSIASPQNKRDSFLIAVKKETQGRGGSAYLHDVARVGDILTISRPRNHFELAERAQRSVFIAGGIGVTPIHSMICRLDQLGKPWELHYAVRQRSEALFLDTFWAGGSRFHLHAKDERGGTRLDVAAIVSAAEPDAHLYCCGPADMLRTFEHASEGRPSGNVHLEFFASDIAVANEGGFTVELARSGRTLTVLPGQTILEALQQAGLTAEASCEQGVCGTCETRVLAGIPDHRDLLLSPEERAANDVMMICCSGSLTPVLVLDR